MEFLHKELDLAAGDLVREVSLSGNGANVQLLDPPNYQAYRDRRQTVTTAATSRRRRPLPPAAGTSSSTWAETRGRYGRPFASCPRRAPRSHTMSPPRNQPQQPVIGVAPPGDGGCGRRRSACCRGPARRPSFRTAVWMAAAEGVEPRFQGLPLGPNRRRPRDAAAGRLAGPQSLEECLHFRDSVGWLEAG